MGTDTYSLFGVSGENFINRDDIKLKILIDPTTGYFGEELKNDRLKYDKLLLIHGLEPKELNNITDKVIDTHHFFDKILTSYKEVIDNCSNSELFLYAASWVITNKNKQLITKKQEYHNIFNLDKKFKLSHVMSGKNYLPGHKLRHKTANLIREKRSYELMFPHHIDLRDKFNLFEDSMFHITIENTKNHNYISEKVIDCFMSYTVPIYWGCPNIGDYFNTDGIIFFETEDELHKILNNLTEDDYYRRKESMIENYKLSYDNYAFWFDRVNEIIKKI